MATPKIAVIDDRGVQGNAAGLGAFIDESAPTEELAATNKNRVGKHGFRLYCEGVIRDSGVPDAQETRQMASHICGVVSRLPFLPDDELKIPHPDRPDETTTEFEMQVIKTARRAEEFLDSEMVWSASALKLARVALTRRKLDPDGKLGKSWVNDPLPGETVAA